MDPTRVSPRISFAITRILFNRGEVRDSANTTTDALKCGTTTQCQRVNSEKLVSAHGRRPRVCMPYRILCLKLFYSKLARQFYHRWAQMRLHNAHQLFCRLLHLNRSVVSVGQ